MSESTFPSKDLFRRRLQTSVVILTLALCLASTLFLLLFAGRTGFGVSLRIEGVLTAGFSNVLSAFVVFLSFLIFTVGGIITSFMVFLMMSQRTRDIGLMKAAGCPTNLVFSYFMLELLIVTLIGSVFGSVLGIAADFLFPKIIGGLSNEVSVGPPNLWVVLFVFVVYSVLALVFGSRPIVIAARLPPAKALSPSMYLGLNKEPGFKVVSKSVLAIKLGLRGLSRRKSATFRVLLCLTAVFLLVTVSVAGGIIAEQTTTTWAKKATGTDIILIGHTQMCQQYLLLLSKFHEAMESSEFNYADPAYSISPALLLNLRQQAGARIDPRLMIEDQITEIQGVLYEENGEVSSVGDSRTEVSLIVGIDPHEALTEWFVKGEFFRDPDEWNAVLGDTVALDIFDMPLNQTVLVLNRTFDIVGVCIDPINNGNVTYVPLSRLQNMTGLDSNIILAKIDYQDRARTLSAINSTVSAFDPDFQVTELNQAAEQNLNFLDFMWSSLMMLPIFSLIAAAFCLIGYVMLAIAEQGQEFGILRALGVRSKSTIEIVAVQNLIVLLASYAIGVAFGIIITLWILIPEPMMTIHALVQITGWLLMALFGTFSVSLYPALKFAKRRLLDTMMQS